MIFTLLNLGFRVTYWVADLTLGSAWRWYGGAPEHTVETLAERVRQLNLQVAALERRLAEPEPEPEPEPQ